MKLQLAKELMVTVMRRYPELGKVYPVKGGIKYQGGVVNDFDVIRIMGELYG